ncbi:MAG TPA: metallophosphoesterase family protein [Gemmatimonadota bacterium]|nr:metallophosphoesterase family protein [Gemmatimonadota bacterium]
MLTLWRCALLADIHANLPALEAVLDDVHRRGLEAAYHLGDLVGYAPWPDDVVARLVEEGIPGVAGNYDSTIAADAEHCGCRAEDPVQEALAHQSYAWTLTHVSTATKTRLRALPFRVDLRPGGGHHSGPTLRIVHGAPTLNTLYWDADRSDDFARKMAGKLGAIEGDAVVFGHTHIPWKRSVDGVLFVNAGSVGRPKDGDPRASWAVASWDGTRITVDHVRTEYDVERTAAAILDSDLPDAFADDLRRGGPARNGMG